jgi:hypothetical protein
MVNWSMSDFAALALDHLTTSPTDHVLTGSAAREAEDLRGAIDEYTASRQNLETHFRAIEDNPELSTEGRAARRAEAVAAWDEGARSLIVEAQAQADRAVRTRQERVQLPPLDGDPVLSEARLQNARADLRMILDPLPQRELVDSMRGLLSDGGPEIRHLLLSEHWSGLYFRSRGAPGFTSDWTPIREEYLPALLPAAGKAALSELRGLREVVLIPSHLADLQRADAVKYRQ